MTMTFAPATKKALKARVALEGPSGSGKTWTGLLTARALAGPHGTIGVIDTERRKASLYADTFKFDTLPLDRFAPDVLIEALAASAAVHHDVCLVDSFSHFWMGTDGLLEQVDRAAKKTGGGNTFAGWKDVRPAERRMIDALLSYPGHLIVTLRTKSDWVIEENDRGKKVPKKIGLKAEQREGLEYEFDLVGTMDLENTLVVTKSRCPTLSGAVLARPDESFGRTLLNWLDAGEGATTSAAELRDELLDNPGASLDEIRAVRDRARIAGLLATAILDEHGDTTTLNDWIVARGHAAAAPPPPPTRPTPAPSTQDPVDDTNPWDDEPVDDGPRMARESQHKRMHVLWGQLAINDRAERLLKTGQVLKRQVDTSKTLTEADADTLLEFLENRVKTNGRAKPAPATASGPATADQRKEIVRLLDERGLGRPSEKLAFCNEVIAPDSVASAKDLTEFQAAQVLGALKAPVPA